MAENAGGLRGLKYGVTRDYVMGIEFFDAAGDIVKTGSRTVKCATGYNLTGLLVGSEGTLGVFNEITVKLIHLPAWQKTMGAVFDQLDTASETVAAIIADRIIPAALEIMDNVTIRAVEDYTHVGLPVDAAALLLIEVDGHRAQTKEDAEKTEALCRKMGAASIRVARNAGERDGVWAARRSALSARAKLKPTLVLGGTLSGEHSTGIAKSGFLEKETSPATIRYSRQIKKAFNSKSILNPGKIIGG